MRSLLLHNGGALVQMLRRALNMRIVVPHEAGLEITAHGTSEQHWRLQDAQTTASTARQNNQRHAGTEAPLLHAVQVRLTTTRISPLQPQHGDQDSLTRARRSTTITRLVFLLYSPSFTFLMSCTGPRAAAALARCCDNFWLYNSISK